MCYHWLDKDLSPDTPKDDAWASWWFKYGVPASRGISNADYGALCKSQRAAFERAWAARAVPSAKQD